MERKLAILLIGLVVSTFILCGMAKTRTEPSNTNDEVRICLKELKNVRDLNMALTDKVQLKGDDRVKNLLHNQYLMNEGASARLLRVLNSTPDDQVAAKGDLVKVMESAHKFRYELNQDPVNTDNLLESEKEMLIFIDQADNNMNK